MSVDIPSTARPQPFTQLRVFLNRPLIALALLSLFALTLTYQPKLAADLSSPGIVLSGFYDLEGRSSGRPLRWTNDDAHFWLGGIGKQAYHLTITLSSARPNDVALPNVRVLANDTPVASFQAPRPIRDFAFDIPSDAVSLSGDLDLRIESDTFAPPNDLRSLGIAVYALRVETASGAPPVTWPAPVPLALGIIAVSMTFLAGSAFRLPGPAAWAVALLLLGLLGAGIAVSRPLAVEALPWCVLLSVIAYVAGTTLRRSP